MRPFASREILLPALSGGIAAGFLFSLSLGSESGGILLVTLPVLLVGLALGIRPAAFCSLVASLTAGLLTGLSGAAFFAGFVALPAIYFLYRALSFRGDDRDREWYSMLRLLSELTIAVACVFTLLAMTTRDLGGLEALAPHNLADSFKDADPDFAAAAQAFIHDFSFVLLALMGWIWLLALYALAVLSNALLKLRSHTLRPSLGLEPHGIPASVLVLLAASAVLSFLGSAADRFTAQTLFLILLLPYFLSGMAFVHAWSIRRGITFRKLWLTCFYIVLICIRWPILAVIAAGLYLQLSEMLDRRAEMR